MATKAGSVSPKVRHAYRVEIADDSGWRRPELKTAELIWSELETWELLPSTRLAHLLPKRGCTENDIRIAKQSLVVALDCAIAAGDRDAMLTKNVLFDALALRWSRQYRQGRRTGARVSYDMRTKTVSRARRELVLAGVRLDTLWEIVTGPWSQSGLNRLFSVRRRGSKMAGHALGYRVDVNLGSTALEVFEAAVEADGQYRRRQQTWPLLLADDPPRPRRRSIRQKVCAERPYNVVNLGKESERVLAILESTRVQFNVELFRQDYEARQVEYLQARAEPRRVRTPEEQRQYRKLKGFVAAWRRLYRQTEAIPIEFIEVGGPPSRIPFKRLPIDRRVWIRSQFFRASNRRYHAANFWPEWAPKEFRGRWFGLPLRLPRHFWDEGPPDEPTPTAAGFYVERDVVTSQIQTLAAFIGIGELEALAAADLKGWLADRIWTQHLETDGGLLADGYEGRDDERLIVFAKAHLMRFYGGALNKIVRKCGRDEAKYGPGWRTTRGLWAAATIKPGTRTGVLVESGVTEAAATAEKFFLELPPWIDELDTFLEACRTLATKCPEGVVFHDPLETECEVRWNHAQRATTHVGHEELEVRPWGKDTKRGFVPLPAGSIDRAALRRFVTPCLTHMLDSYFSSHVLLGLRAAGVTDVIALHDAWLVSEALPDGDDPTAVLSGPAVLKGAVEAAGKPWLEGLGGVYDQLVSDLGDDKTFGPFVRGMRDRWRKRVDAKGWPKFLSH